MPITKLDDGTLLIPKRIEADGMVGDTVEEIKPNHELYGEYLAEFEKERAKNLP